MDSDTSKAQILYSENIKSSVQNVLCLYQRFNFCVNFQLTGNEDGRCDSENKTIQFNEEVDVVVSLFLECPLFVVIKQHILLASMILI